MYSASQQAAAAYQQAAQARPNGYSAPPQYSYGTPQARTQQPAARLAPQASTSYAQQPSQGAATAQDKKRIREVALGEGDAQSRTAKKRKPTDRSLPTFKPSATSAITLPPQIEATNSTLASLSSSYLELQKLERKLDWTVARKRVEMAESVGVTGAGTAVPARTRRKLKVRISNECSDQLWQQGEEEAVTKNEVDFVTGEGVPSWVLRVEGQLMGMDGQPLVGEAPPTQRFSSLISSLTVEVEPSDVAGADPTRVDWERKDGATPQDGFTVSGRSTTNAKAKISLTLNHYPERFAIDSQLGTRLDINEDSRAGIMSSLWAYIKKNNLQDAEDRKQIRCDAWLKSLAGSDKIAFNLLPELITRHISRARPVIFEHTIVVESDPTEATKCYDFLLDVDEPLRPKILEVLAALTQQTAAPGSTTDQISKLDEQIADSANKARTVKQKRDTLSAFSHDPVSYLQTFVSSQSHDIDQILSASDRAAQPLGGVTTEQLRSAEFYRQDWLRDAINLHQGRIFGGQVQQAMVPAAVPAGGTSQQQQAMMQHQQAMAAQQQGRR